MRAYILVSHVIDRETQLHALGGIDVYYHPFTPFEGLDDVYKTDCILEIRFVTWCVVKLYCCVALCSAFHILILANDIIHRHIKIISQSQLVGYVTKTSDFSDHIQVNCLFLTRGNYCSLKATQYSKSLFLITVYQIY